LLGSLFGPEDEGSMFFQTVGELLPDYIALHPSSNITAAFLKNPVI
jgi:hypothetical protein